jgi:hypothetical protein
MQVVEEMRRTLREIKDVNKLDSNLRRTSLSAPTRSTWIAGTQTASIVRTGYARSMNSKTRRSPRECFRETRRDDDDDDERVERRGSAAVADRHPLV